MPATAGSRFRSIFVSQALLVLAASCTSKTDASRGEDAIDKPPVICTTTYPMKYFAERISRGKVRVECPVPADPDAFLRTISPDIIRRYQKADLIVINGAGYEKWVDVVNLPDSRIVNTARPLESAFVLSETFTHSHGQGGPHAHRGIDGHTWLDPLHARVQAEAIRKAMTRRFPDHSAEFEKGFSSLAEDLAELDRSFSASAALHYERPILASHPSYNYIAKRYGWDLVNLKLGLDPSAMPDDSAFAEIARVLALHPAEFILWEKRPAAGIAERMRSELGLRCIEFSPCKEIGEEDARASLDYMGVMQRNAENIARAFAGARSDD